MATVQELFSAANCFSCLNDRQLAAVQTFLLEQIVQNPSGGSGPHDLLSITHSDTVPGVPVKGSLVVGNSTPKWESFGVGLDGQSLLSDSTAPFGVKWGTPAGGGTVTSFSSGNLSPLFTTSVATATTTPALSFTLTDQDINTFFAGPTGGVAGTPTFRAIVAADLPGGFTGFANPTAMVGLTAVNGNPATTTAMRSDAAPALDQGITPVWTNLHTFSPPANTLAIWVTGSSITGANSQSLIDFRGTWDTTGTPAAILVDVTRINTGASAALMTLRIGGVPRFFVRHDGLTQTTFVDTAVSSSPTALEVYHATTGVPLVNNGVSFDLSMDTDSAERRFGGRYTVDWSTATDATRSSRMRFIVVNSGVTTEVLQVSSVDGVTVKSAPFLQLNPFGASAGNTTHLRFIELAANGFEYVGFKAPDSITSSAIYVLPATAPAANRFLRAGVVAANVSITAWEQIDLAADVIGNLPVANLNSGTGAGATTFWRGDGTWAIPASSGGTVTDFSAGDLEPLFTTTESTTTTTPLLEFVQIPKGANLIFAGPVSGPDANPDFRGLVIDDLTSIGLADGQLIIGSTGTPVVAELTAGANITITPGAGSITIDATNSGGTVTNFSAGDLAPLFTTSEATTTTTPALTFTQITKAANLVFAGPASGGAANPNFRALVTADMPAGTGTVTSFSAGDLTPLFTTSEATATTTPALTFTQITKAANVVFAGPSSGGAANPDFRALVVADLPAGTGTVTNFSAGDLLPLFTTSEATTTTTPALTFAQVTKAANLVFAGPSSGGAANPDFRALVIADFTGLGLTNGQLIIGSTGLAPVAASLTAGANISITPGTGSITIAVTGVVTQAYSTIQEEGSGLTQRSILNFIGPLTAVDDAGNSRTNITLAGAALTKTDDTNVTLTLDGSPTTALLTAASLTLGWTGLLSLARGGTNKLITAVAGAVVWSDTDSFELTAAGTSGQIFVSQGTGSPIWQDPSAASAHNMLSVTHSDTLAASVARGDIIRGNSTPAWSRLAIGAANTYLFSDGTDATWGFVDASHVTFAPGDVTDWNAGVDPGNVDDALDQLANNLSPLLPPSAPALDDIDFDTANGPSGKNTWNAANSIATYSNAPSDSPLNAADALDVTVTAGANAHGVYDYDTLVSVAGTLNEDVAAHSFSYPADSFSPGGSDGGATNTIELYVNNVLIHSTNLLTHVSGNSLNGSSSGFTSLSAATPVQFSDATPFASRTYRMGGWVVTLANLTRGWNTIKVKHVTAAGTVTTDVHEFLLDDEDTLTTYSGPAETITGYAGAGSKLLSGVTYHTSGTATYNVTVNNAYRNTYRDGSAISYQVTNLVAVSSEALAASGGNEALSFTKNKAITASGTYLLNATLTAKTTIDRTVQADTQSAGATVTGVLIDAAGTPGTATSEVMDDEVWRVQSDVSLTDVGYNSSGTSPTGSDWDNTQSLVGADAGHNTGLLMSGGLLQYPTQGTNGGNFGAITNGPAGNPNYSGATGNRTFLRYFYFASPKQNFTFVLTKASATTFATVAVGVSAQAITVELLAPNTTQNGAAAIEWKDALVAYTDDNAIGCQSSNSGLGAGSTSATLNLTLGTRSTSTSGLVVLLRITAASGWTGNLSAITVS